MLQHVATHQPRINWAELYLTAEAAKESFVDVRIVTARSEYDNIVAERRMEMAELQPFDLIQQHHNIPIKESVTITGSGEISVVVNTPDVSDDAMWRALDLVADAMYQLDGKSGTVYFGEPIMFSNVGTSPVNYLN